MGKVKRKKRVKTVEREPTFRERYLSRDSEVFRTLRDIGIAVVVMTVILAGLYAYAGTWPPVVVVESGSMMHDDDSHLGVIDTGDIVIVKSVGSVDDLTTYIEGERRGYETYSDYGDVIVYHPLGRKDVTPVIHRVMFWLEVNNTGPKENWTMSIPELGIFGVKEFGVELAEYGLRNYKATDAKHSGFITMGDNNFDRDGNPLADQDRRARICPEPVKLSWISGVARGELPWFGLIKLWATGTLKGEAPQTSVVAVSVCVFILVILPIMWDILMPGDEGESYIRKKLNGLLRSLGLKRK